MRFLHLADVHLDTPFVGRSSELRDRLRAASREAFRKAVDLAIEREVHAVLIAGDLVDGERLSFATEGFLLEQLRRLDDEGITVVYATGNHDPGRSGTGIQRLRWPENVKVVDGGRPERIEIRDREGHVVGRVTAAGHETRAVTDDLAAAFPPTRGKVPEIAVLHTQVVGSRAAEGHDCYAPSELESLRASGYDYWALGHVHLRQVLSSDPPIHYPGNPQGRHAGERGPKGGLLVRLAPGEAPEVEFVELGGIRWETLTVDRLEGADSLEELERGIADEWTRSLEARGAPAGVEWVVRVELRGGSPLWRELGREEDLKALADQLGGTLGALHVDVRAPLVHPVLRPDDHQDRIDPVGEALRFLVEVRDGRLPPPVAWEELAHRGTTGDTEELAAYVHDLLEDAEGELLARLLGGAGPGGS